MERAESQLRAVENLESNISRSAAELLQTQLYISMHSVRESRLNHARQEHGWFCPLFYGYLMSSQYKRHEVSFDWSWLYVFEQLPDDDQTQTQLQPVPLHVWTAQSFFIASHKGLHHVLCFCIIQIISAMTTRMAWHPCEHNVMSM